ncbi:MAG TPA: bifunctional oligoribonuclease/PAP phosphatase NrnA [Mycobacteriales bacterium]|nr:bifunctional oligoribonuclease/PAP phosphatase NrnA [Mycobacteriales bacterium]
MTPSASDWDDAVRALRGRHEVVLACHLSPDGDALGSMLGLAHALVRMGKRVVPSFSEPFVVPEPLWMLPGLALLMSPARVPKVPELVVTFDSASADRLGDLAGPVGQADDVLVIDHHASNTGYGTLHLVDPNAAATAVLVAELIRRLGVELDPDIAACLYTGLVSDTGSFRHASTTPEVHALAGRLLDTGIRHDLITRELFDTHPFGWVPMLGDVLGRARLETGAVGGLGLVWTHTRCVDLAQRGLGFDQVESVIDVVRTTREAEVACVCKELPGGRWAVSVRSKGRVDVGSVCVRLGGGGHRFAAGFTSESDLDATVGSLRAALAVAPHLPG